MDDVIYKKLPVHFKKYGHEYNQVKRTNNHAMYIVTCGVLFICYEIIKILKTKEKTLITTLKGMKVPKVYPPSESFPSSSQWGIYGFTEQTEQSALKRFKELDSAVIK